MYKTQTQSYTWNPRFTHMRRMQLWIKFWFLFFTFCTHIEYVPWFLFCCVCVLDCIQISRNHDLSNPKFVSWFGFCFLCAVRVIILFYVENLYINLILHIYFVCCVCLFFFLFIYVLRYVFVGVYTHWSFQSGK